MPPKQFILISLFAILTLSLGVPSAEPVTVPQNIPTATVTVPPSPTPTRTALPTPIPYYITATVWESQPAAAILTYHKFKTNRPSTYSTVSRLDFEEELESLYRSGYVSVSLEKWLAGDIRVPVGKRPVIFSMDDVFFRNQIALTAEGIPAKDTGLGVAWEFYKKHPEFGFHWALFSNLGDKPYGEGTSIEQKIQLANVIVWCIEHDAMIYNHTFRHVNLKNTKGLGVTAELRWNDETLRELLQLVHRADLIPKLRNMVALPGGRAPRWEDSQTALYGYTDPDGRKVQAIFNIDYITRPDFLKPPYARKFNPANLPRIVANLEAIEYLVENKEKYPAAKSCRLGPLDQGQSADSVYLAGQVSAAVRRGQCPHGVYVTDKFIFSAETEQTSLIQEIQNDNQP
ncbi:MAG TPA: hypothetical protein PKE48_18960 [Anaerolineales bacterium]|nr:hypothetical protein [Anaerolineales bacterium]